MNAWEAAAGPTVHRQGSRFARPALPARGLDGAPPARLFAAMRSWLAVSIALKLQRKREVGARQMWRGLRLFGGSTRPATVAPWLPRKNRGNGACRLTRKLLI